MLSHAHKVDYGAGEVLYRQGSASDTVTFITEGLVKLVTYLPNGRSRIVRLHRPGSILGMSGLIGRKNEHTAVAVTAVSTLRLPLEAIQRLRSDTPTTYARLLERWHIYLQHADTWITEFSTGPIRGRVARLLTFLSNFEPHAADSTVQLLTCEEMASILGVTTESVSRILAELKRQQVLTVDDSDARELYQADIGRLMEIGTE
jgi:CRP-like cAMP-binding protein